MKNNLINNDENVIKFYLDKEIYSIKTIMKAAYNYIEDFYIMLNYCDGYIEVILEGKTSKSYGKMKKYKGEFYNELLRQNIRYMISKDTKNIRELIIGRALYDTCIEYDDTNNVTEKQSEEDKTIKDELNIFVNWFDNNEG
jgi:His-Xaa-Ser system protein HxsD